MQSRGHTSINTIVLFSPCPLQCTLKLVWGVAVLVLLPAYAHAISIEGQARIVDGDTLYIGKVKIRLHGIDTPETRQTCTDQDGEIYHCGTAATKALHALIGASPVRCDGVNRDRYKRLIAVCYSGKVNLNAEMVRNGLALAYRRYSKDYVQVEREAAFAKRGMWSGRFQPPWVWRRR